jgi:hypothetical protein
MLEFRTSLPLINIDVKRYTKTLDRTMGQIIRESAREWLRAILVSVAGDFPVWSGAAKSTLIPLGRFLGQVKGLEANPVQKAPDRRDLGENSQDFYISSKDFNYEFFWSTSLLHYYTNEFYHVPIPHISPWHTLDAGEDAWLKYVEDALNRRLPNLSNFIDTVVIRTRG